MLAILLLQTNPHLDFVHVFFAEIKIQRVTASPPRHSPYGSQQRHECRPPTLTYISVLIISMFMWSYQIKLFLHWEEFYNPRITRIKYQVRLKTCWYQRNAFKKSYDFGVFNKPRKAMLVICMCRLAMSSTSLSVRLHNIKSTWGTWSQTEFKRSVLARPLSAMFFFFFFLPSPTWI